MIIRRPSARAGGRRSGFRSYGPAPGSGGRKVGHPELDQRRAGMPPLGEVWFWWKTNFPDWRGSVLSGSPEVFEEIPNPGTLGGLCTAGAGSRPTVAPMQVEDRTERVALFDGTNDLHDHNGALADWKPPHQACTVLAAIRPADIATRYWFSTTDAAGANTGLALYTINTRQEIRVCNGSGAYMVNANTGNGSIPTDEVSIVCFRLDATNGYDCRVNGTSLASGALVGAPAAGNPSYVGRVGSGAALAPFLGNLCEILIWPWWWTNADVALVETYLAAEWQDQEVPLDLGADIWFSHRLGLTLDAANPQAGDQVAGWADQSGKAHDATQAVDAKQFTVSTVADADGNLGLTADGTADCMILSAGAGWNPAVSHSFGCVVDIDSPAGADDYLLDAQTGRLAWGATGQPPGSAGHFDGAAWQNPASAIGGPQVQLYCLDSAGGGAGNFYRGGAFAGACAYPNLRALGGSVAICSRFTQDARFFDGTIYDFTHYPRVLTPANIWAENERLYSEFPSRFTNKDYPNSDTSALVVPGTIGGAANETFIDFRQAISLTMAANRISQADDLSAEVASGAQQNATQGVGANQPLWVADPDGSGIPAALFDRTRPDYLVTAINPSAWAEITILLWHEFNPAAFVRTLAGCWSAPVGCFLQIGINNAVHVGWGGTSPIDPVPLTVNGWYFSALTVGGGFVRLYNDRTGVLALRASAAIGAAPPALPLYIGALNNLGAPLSLYPYDGHISLVRVEPRAFTFAELDRVRALTFRS